MSATDALLARVDALLSKGQAVDETEYQSGGASWVEHGKYHEWRTQSLSALEAIVGIEHSYTKVFGSEVRSPSTPYSVKAGIGILIALREDIAKGYMRRLETLVSSEVFSDFLEMAQHLLGAGYKDPAASLCGAVLEDGLRRIAASKTIKSDKRDGLVKLNEKCAQAAIYTALVSKQVVVWTDIRNNADHGHFAQYTAADVGDMVRGVSNFLAQHL